MATFTYSDTHLVPRGPGDSAYVPFGDSSAAYISTIGATVQRALEAAQYWANSPPTLQITEGEDVGYREYEPIIPMGNEGGGFVWPGILTGGFVPERVSVPTMGDPVWEPGSIFAPGGGWDPLPEDAYDPPPPDTGVGEAPLYDEYEGDVGVAHDWMHTARTIAEGYFAPTTQPLALAPASVPVGGGTAVPYTGSCPPRKTRTLTIDCATGQEIKRTRRRRRRLLTSSDINDLAALKAIVGGGQAMNLAVARAVRS